MYVRVLVLISRNQLQSSRVRELQNSKVLELEGCRALEVQGPRLVIQGFQSSRGLEVQSSQGLKCPEQQVCTSNLQQFWLEVCEHVQFQDLQFMLSSCRRPRAREHQEPHQEGDGFKSSSAACFLVRQLPRCQDGVPSKCGRLPATTCEHSRQGPLS